MIINLDGLVVEIFLGFFETCSEEFVDYIIYIDYIVNRSSFIYVVWTEVQQYTRTLPQQLPDMLHALTVTLYRYVNQYQDLWHLWC